MNILDIETLRKLPTADDDTAGVYFLWREDELLYIGCSKNIRRRLVRHKRDVIPFTRHTCIAIDYQTDGWMNHALEQKYIARYSPPHNVMHTAEWNAARVWA
jgi:excinuclease UvrABC nuclease subunit